MKQEQRIVVYTALFGDYGGLVEQPKFKNVDYVCYTNRRDLRSRRWQLIYIDDPIPGDNTRSNRYYKILPHKHLSKDYSISVYIDANVLILKDIYQFVTQYMSSSKMACFDHNQNKKDKRNCIYEEHRSIEALVRSEKKVKDDPDTIRKQMKRFRDEGYPENYGLITAPILIRQHFDKEVMAVMEVWWNVVLNESKRDQLSFNYAAWKLNFTDFTLLPGDVRTGNPWFYSISHRKNYFSKVTRVRLKQFFKLLRA